MSHHQPHATGSHAEVTKHADTSPHTTHKSFKTDRRDKPKHSGRLGATSGPKKGGGGGKGTWGRPGDEAQETALDPNDPNYDEDAAGAHLPPSISNWQFHPEKSQQIKFANSLADLAQFKKTIKEAAAEYLDSNDSAEFCRIVTAVGCSVFHSDLPAILMKYSFELADEQRARVSNLLLALYKGSLITPTQMGAGLRKIYNQLPDILVDAPHAKRHLREHVAFAVAAGFLDPQLAKQLEAEHEALADTAKVTAVKKKIDAIVEDYFAAEDLPDAVVALRELDAPYLHFEVVKRLLSQALDRGNRQREGASVFLSDQVGHLLSLSDIERGFTLLLERMEDLSLDCPTAFRDLSVFVARAVVDEVLPPAFLVRVDLGESDAGSQVLQRAQQLLKQPDASDALTSAWEALEEQKQRQQKGGDNAPAAASAAAGGAEAKAAQ